MNTRIVRLKWHGNLPSDKNIDKLEMEVMIDIKRNITRLSKPSNLTFHTVFVGKTLNDEIVAVWGEEGDDDYFHCEYVSNPEWVSLKDLEEMENNNGNIT